MPSYKALTLATIASLFVTNEAIPKGKWTNIENNKDVADITLASKSGCGRDDYFAFGAYRGTENKLVIEFEGGGLCASYDQCIGNIGLLNGGTCTKNALPPGWDLTDQVYQGLPRHQNPENPVKNWNHIFIPYCTCDFHVGSQAIPVLPGTPGTPGGPVAETPADGQFNFNGFSNAQFVLEWILKRYKSEFGQKSSPDKVLVTGCSAGAYAANLYLDYINQGFTDSEVYSFIDSGYGDLSLLSDALALWGSDAFTGSDLLSKTFLAPDSTKQVSEIVDALAEKYPESKHASFSFFNDVIVQNQPALVSQVTTLEEAARCNVRSIIDGEAPVASATQITHCIITFDRFYDIKLPNSDTKLVAYLDDFVNNRCVESFVNDESGITTADYCSADSKCATASATRASLAISSFLAFLFVKFN